MKNLTLSKLFLDFIRPLKVLKTLFTYFNHQIKTKATIILNINILYFPSIFLCGRPPTTARPRLAKRNVAAPLDVI